jgi:PAS domain S-box-containing protein
MASSDTINREQVILNSINEGVFTVDMNWRITSFNRTAEQLTGVSCDEAIGRSCSDVFHTDVCETACALRHTLNTGKPVINTLAHIVNSDGDRLPVRLSTALLRDDAGEVIGGVETMQDLSRIEQLRKELEASYTFEDIVGRSAPMQKLFDILPQIAESSSTVLLEGESGTGKELFARAIHQLSAHKDGPFVAVNCAALPDSLLESELFGHVKGAFTDAYRDKSGRFERAHGGTIFLDEIGDISPAMQVRLLRVLQERVVEPLGSVTQKAVNVRVVVATHHDLKSDVKAGHFREDLYYRIRVIHLGLPPLRERRKDIPLLINHLLAKIAGLQDRDPVSVSEAVLAKLLEYEYPGNVRELENILEQSFVISRGGVIELQHLPTELLDDEDHTLAGLEGMSLQEMERALIENALRRFGGHRGKSARQLGIDPSTLYRKMKLLRIEGSALDGTRG